MLACWWAVSDSLAGAIKPSSCARLTPLLPPAGTRPALGLTAADLGGGAFGSPQSTLGGDPSGTASAATRTSLRNSSSLNTGGPGGGRPGLAPAAAAGTAGEDGSDPSPKRRTRQSIRTTSRLNAAYAIEMMRAEGAKDMRHIMDALVEPADAQVRWPSGCVACRRCNLRRQRCGSRSLLLTATTHAQVSMYTDDAVGTCWAVWHLWQCDARTWA